MPPGDAGTDAAHPADLADLADRLVTRLRAGGRTVACAESLTGGLLSATIVDVPGASNALLGGIVAYATELKHVLVGVDDRLLAERGPVDPEVARQLAEGIRARCAVGGRGADLGIATTGVAGPDPQDGRRPGLVYVGVASARGARAVELHVPGDRAAVRRAAVARALEETLAELDALDAASVSA